MLVREQIKRLLYLALYALYTRAKLFVLPLAIVPVVVILLAVTAQKKYTNHATILIEESALLNPYLDDLSFSFDLTNRMAALSTLVISRKVLIAVARETNLVPKNASPAAIEKVHQELSQSLSLSLVGDELVRVNFIWHEPSQMKPVLEKIVEKLAKKDRELQKIRNYFTDAFFTTDLKILKEHINPFLNFCLKKNIITIFKRGETIKITKILIQESKLFLRKNKY